MESNLLVSIIIPVFNVAPYLVEALNSVISQTYENLEIVIIDDGSTDESGHICDEYKEKDNRIIVVHQENKGLSTARNIGLGLISGDAIAFLDSDDAYHPDFVRKMVDAMIREKADLVICKSTVHNTSGNMSQNGQDQMFPSLGKGKYDRVTALQALVDRSIDHTVWNKLYSRRLWGNIRFPDGCVFEDVDTTYRIIDNCRSIYVLNEPLYLHRKRPESITETRSRKNINDWRLAFSHLELFIIENIPDIFTQEHLARFKQTQLARLVGYYVYWAQINSNEAKAFCEDMRVEIINTGCEVGVGNEGIRVSLYYWMICKCPWLIGIVCSAYYPIRRIIRLIVR